MVMSWSVKLVSCLPFTPAVSTCDACRPPLWSRFPHAEEN